MSEQADVLDGLEALPPGPYKPVRMSPQTGHVYLRPDSDEGADRLNASMSVGGKRPSELEALLEGVARLPLLVLELRESRRAARQLREQRDHWRRENSEQMERARELREERDDLRSLVRKCSTEVHRAGVPQTDDDGTPLSLEEQIAWLRERVRDLSGGAP